MTTSALISPGSSIALTEDAAIEALQSFFRGKPFLFFGTGMSCAVDIRFGMGALKDELLRRIAPDASVPDQIRQWEQVKDSLLAGLDLESALDTVTDTTLLQQITTVTGRFVASLDCEYAFRIANGTVTWPATRLLKRLIDTLPEGDRILNVLTPNYDLLCEYACDYAGVPYSTGYQGGVERKADWGAANRSMQLPETVCQRGKSTCVYKYRKHLRLFKVHGSLNTFYHRSAVVENNAWMWYPPEYAQRVIITPGLNKYETLQCYRRELLASADTAIERENHFLFLGYGFNDKHLEEYIKRKLIAQGCHGLIITRDSNPRIEALLAEAPNLWLVCKAQEVGDDGTRIYNVHHSDWLSLPTRRLWDVNEFTQQILGG